jgi:hypothetical protein
VQYLRLSRSHGSFPSSALQNQRRILLPPRKRRKKRERKGSMMTEKEKLTMRKIESHFVLRNLRR